MFISPDDSSSYSAHSPESGSSDVQMIIDSSDEEPQSENNAGVTENTQEHHLKHNLDEDGEVVIEADLSQLDGTCDPINNGGHDSSSDQEGEIVQLFIHHFIECYRHDDSELKHTMFLYVKYLLWMPYIESILLYWS